MIQFNQDLYKFPSEFFYGIELNVEEKEYMEKVKKKKKMEEGTKRKYRYKCMAGRTFSSTISYLVACLERGSSYRRSSIINSTWFIKKLLTLTRSTRRLIYVKSMSIRILFS